jgi:xylulokinase
VPNVLAIDLGTSGVKVAVVDERGRALASASAPLTTTFLPDGGAEQDPEVWWQEIGRCARSIVAGLDVTAVVVTSQYMSIVAVDERGTPLGPAIMWMDERGRGHHRAPSGDGDLELWLDRHGMFPAFGDQAHIALVRATRPDDHDRAAALLEPVDALNARLTGRICATQTTAMPLMTVDNRAHGALDHDPELVGRVDLDPAKLPPLVPFDEPIGTLTSDAAAHLGLAASTVVLPGTIDSITSGVGCGVVDGTAVALLVGTTSVIVSNLDHKGADYEHDLVAFPSPIPGRWFVMAENGVGGRALEVGIRLLGIDFDAAEDLASAAAPGSGGVLFQPWLAGSIAPASDSRVRGGFVGIGLETTRADVVRSIYEGVALNAAWLLPHVAALCGQRWDTVRLGGGGAQSAFWGQVFADVLGVRVERTADPTNTNARGAALLAHAQLGQLAVEDIPALIDVAHVHEPDASTRAVYDALLADLADVHGHARSFYADRRRRRRSGRN